MGLAEEQVIKEAEAIKELHEKYRRDDEEDARRKQKQIDAQIIEFKDALSQQVARKEIERKRDQLEELAALEYNAKREAEMARRDQEEKERDRRMQAKQKKALDAQEAQNDTQEAQHAMRAQKDREAKEAQQDAREEHSRREWERKRDEMMRTRELQMQFK